MIRCCIFDLDGTLLNTRDRINPKSIRIINELIRQGMLFTYATARSLVSASVVTEGLSVTVPVIVYNGAVAQDERVRCTIQQELYRPEYWCEIMPAKATKAEAIKTLKRLWKCDRIVSFGDAINDIPMFEISDECYAVENAVSELKEAASGIIGSNEKDGVAKWLWSHVKTE